MRRRITGLLNLVTGLGQDQRGITGLETAIVLIAFVVVASVFAFAVLSTGLLSSERSKETVLGGLRETSATLSIRGGVIVDANSQNDAIDSIKFTLSSASQSAEAVDLSTGATVVTYVDKDHAINCDNPVVAGTPKCSWKVEWVIGSGTIVDPSEQVDLTVTLTSLTPNALVIRKEFTIQVRPSSGAVVIVNKTIPGEIKGIMELN